MFDIEQFDPFATAAVRALAFWLLIHLVTYHAFTFTPTDSKNQQGQLFMVFAVVELLHVGISWFTFPLVPILTATSSALTFPVLDIVMSHHAYNIINTGMAAFVLPSAYHHPSYILFFISAMAIAVFYGLTLVYFPDSELLLNQSFINATTLAPPLAWATFVLIEFSIPFRFLGTILCGWNFYGSVLYVQSYSAHIQEFAMKVIEEQETVYKTQGNLALFFAAVPPLCFFMGVTYIIPRSIVFGKRVLRHLGIVHDPIVTHSKEAWHFYHVLPEPEPPRQVTSTSKKKRQ